MRRIDAVTRNITTDGGRLRVLRHAVLAVIYERRQCPECLRGIGEPHLRRCRLGVVLGQTSVDGRRAN